MAHTQLEVRLQFLVDFCDLAILLKEEVPFLLLILYACMEVVLVDALAPQCPHNLLGPILLVFNISQDLLHLVSISGKPIL